MVRRAMEVAESLAWGNPSSVHSQGREARRFVEDVREELGRKFLKSPRDVLFTGGGTEANHLALNGAKFLVTSRIEHPSIVAQAEFLLAQGSRVEFVELDPKGVISPQAVEAALERLKTHDDFPASVERDGGINNSNTALVAVMAGNHETGVLQPIREIAEAVHSFGARLHVDAVQLVGRGSLERLEHADSISISAHKFRGPKGIGALLFECGYVPTPLGHGGAQERGLRPGTVDAVAVAGLGAALGRLEESENAYARAQDLRDRLEQALRSGPGRVLIHGSESDRLPHVSNFSLHGWKGDELVAALDLCGVCVSSGSACSAGSSEPSSIILAMLGREAAEGAVRVSFGEDSTKEELQALLGALNKLGILTAA